VGRNTIGPWSHPWWDSGESPSSYLPLSTNHGKGSIVTSYKVDPRPRVGSKTCPLQARRFRTARSPHPRTAFQPASPNRSPSTCSTASDSATKTSATILGRPATRSLTTWTSLLAQVERPLPPFWSPTARFRHPHRAGLCAWASLALAAVDWSQSDRHVPADAVAVPVAYENPTMYHSSAVHGCIDLWVSGNCDSSNVWLSE
jgi:hypothetical protein